MVSPFELFCYILQMIWDLLQLIKRFIRKVLSSNGIFSNQNYDLYSDMQKCVVELNANANRHSISHLSPPFSFKSIANVLYISFSHLFPEWIKTNSLNINHQKSTTFTSKELFRVIPLWYISQDAHNMFLPNEKDNGLFLKCCGKTFTTMFSQGIVNRFYDFIVARM